MELDIFGKGLLAWMTLRSLWVAKRERVRDTQEERDAMADALSRSCVYARELSRHEATHESVAERLGLNEIAKMPPSRRAREFERVLGVKWPLGKNLETWRALKSAASRVTRETVKREHFAASARSAPVARCAHETGAVIDADAVDRLSMMTAALERVSGGASR